MNNEIKVILEYLKDEKWEYYPSDMTPYKVLVMEERDKLLDYITNLQQENERLKEEYINVRNYIKMRNVSTEVEDKALLYNIELENINKKKYLDYKTRCEKAIEYIKSNTIHYTRYLSLEKTIIPKLELQDYQYNVLLNILQNGSDSQ